MVKTSPTYPTNQNETSKNVKTLENIEKSPDEDISTSRKTDFREEEGNCTVYERVTSSELQVRPLLIGNWEILENRKKKNQ